MIERKSFLGQESRYELEISVLLTAYIIVH